MFSTFYFLLSIFTLVRHALRAHGRDEYEQPGLPAPRRDATFSAFCFLLSTFTSASLLLTACGNGSQANDAVPITGELLFNETNQIIPGAPSCRSCHVIEAGAEPVVGPNLAGIALIAGTRVPGQTADVYLRTAIVAPNDYLVAGYQPGIMPRTYGDLLTEDQIAALVNYMLTLE